MPDLFGNAPLVKRLLADEWVQPALDLLPRVPRGWRTRSWVIASRPRGLG